ncbi:MAG: MarR family transcriptional regulator [Comamonas sp.]|nr:MarR family transcriptional regulator [Comamonas sp.]
MSFADAPSRDRLGFLMVTLTRQWRRFVEEQLAASGLTDATWTPLLHLRAWGDGVTQKELAERVGLDSSSLVRLLDILEGKGWVERRADAADRRSKRIFLTDEGHGAVDSIRATMLEAELSMLQDLDDAEVETMLGSVNKIRARIEQMHGQRCTQAHPEAEERT